jgi:hypothetical protein
MNIAILRWNVDPWRVAFLFLFRLKYKQKFAKAQILGSYPKAWVGICVIAFHLQPSARFAAGATCGPHPAPDEGDQGETHHCNDQAVQTRGGP